MIDQGTILDRIDYNIEQAADRVTSAVVELNKANEYARASWTSELPDLGLSAPRGQLTPLRSLRSLYE